MRLEQSVPDFADDIFQWILIKRNALYGDLKFIGICWSYVYK